VTRRTLTTATQTISNLATEIQRMPERMDDARRALGDWRHSALRTVRRYPGRSVLGAFAIGFVLAKIGRYL